MSDQQRKIYQNDGDRYEDLISREDHQGNILKALNEVILPDGLDIIDTGAGTGRLTLMLAEKAKSIHAFDVSDEMLRVCRKRLETAGLSNWHVEVADHRSLPVDDKSADLVVSGWSVAYLAVWNPETCEAELDKWMQEMQRIIRPNGYVVLFETLGTGNDLPIRVEHLQNYYPWLDEVGFQNKWIRTDYKFKSIEEAEELSRFFFGDELGDKVKNNNWTILPECTGIYWKKF